MELTRNRVCWERIAVDCDCRYHGCLKLLAESPRGVGIRRVDLFGVADADDDPLTRGGLPAWPQGRHPALVRAARVRCGSRARWEKWSERYEVSRGRRRRLSGCGDCCDHRDENE